MINNKQQGIIDYFGRISAIPRGSGNEKGIADSLCAFTEDNSLEYIRDAADNVFIRKPASPGNEDLPPILFQGHTDMVCESAPGIDHDFLNDGLELEEKDGYLSAKGTTLGADDGIAVAIMMYLLTDEELVHPPFECLFTTSEETGMNGAKSFDFSNVKARTLINLDSEDFSEMIVSCAGGARLYAEIETEKVPFPKNVLKAASVEIGGLAGGHSGADIDLGRINALKLMGEFLAEYYENEPFNIISVSGGSKDNAIPREARAVVAVSDVDKLKEYAKAYERSSRSGALKEDRKLFIRVNRYKGEHENMLTYACSSRIIDGMALAPYGVLKMSNELPGLVRTSTNFGILDDENDRFGFTHLVRSSSEKELDTVLNGSTRLYRRIGAGEILIRDRYPGWDYSGETKIAKLYKKAYEKITGEKIKVKAIHAGLECGLIKNAIPDMEIISVGPDIFDIHTPAERLKLDTVGKIYEIITETLGTYIDGQ